MNSTRISQALLKAVESFSGSPTHSWLCGVVVKTPDWKSVGCEFKYKCVHIHWVPLTTSSVITSTRIQRANNFVWSWHYLIHSNVKKFSYNKHPATTSTFSCIKVLVVSGTQCIGSFVYWNEKPSLISLILNTKSGKHECVITEKLEK